jgi:hypothetical protein
MALSVILSELTMSKKNLDELELEIAWVKSL